LKGQLPCIELLQVFHLIAGVLLMSSVFTGLWKRQSIQIGDSEPYEDATVLWLQAQTYFADIRIPLNQPSLPSGQSLLNLTLPQLLEFAKFKAFAGTIDATESWIRWNRKIDFKPDPSRVDQGKVHFEGQNLIEVGEFFVNGDAQSYLEVWVPQIAGPTDCLVLELAQEVNQATQGFAGGSSGDFLEQAQTVTHPCALLVAVGEHFIRVYDDRNYPPEFAAPDPVQLSATELKRLMQFQVDYGKRTGEAAPWQILLSNDPSRVGTALQARTGYQARWQDEVLIETWKTAKGENLEHHWQVYEGTSNKSF